MPFKRMTVLFLLAFFGFSAASARADAQSSVDASAFRSSSSPWFSLATELASPAVLPDIPASTRPTGTVTASPETRLRKLLADFSMTLRNIRYRRGGREPATGFDCSGFVHYVFHHSVGADLPPDSASQFMSGAKVTRADMQTGDLVFFRIRGRHISHVGIYLDNGRFIHSPSTGKSVSISRLDDPYWAKHFVGAKRPKVLS